jgi:hypothetical protein
VESIDLTVSVPALQNWSSCTEAYSRNLITKVQRPNDATIQLILKNGTPHIETLTEVLVQSDENSGISCPTAQHLDQPRELHPARDVLVSCTRTYVDVRRKGVDYQVLPGGSITVVTSLSSYSYGFPEVFREEITPPEKTPQRIALSLAGNHVGTHAYWGGGSQLLRCSSVEPPGPNFELVVIGTREEPVRNFANPRGRCGVAPYCDSAESIVQRFITPQLAKSTRIGTTGTRRMRYSEAFRTPRNRCAANDLGWACASATSGAA